MVDIDIIEPDPAVLKSCFKNVKVDCSVLAVLLSHFCRAMISEKNALSGCYIANVVHDFQVV